MHHGSCLCRSIRFTVSGELEAPFACHCSQCRKQSGHFFASTNVRRDRLQITGEEHLAWFQSSPKVRRGFCSKCGSWLFWDPPAKEWTSIAMRAFDKPTSTRLQRHIFVADKGDYYDIADGLPQNEH
ncbi:GFA family protein [Piscinibacter sakaiensis]|uniref:GFA family protein n=1 Tax=Piscinibacter sakaiensis TaxID=1547922 RepID=UPI003AAC83E1